MYDLHTGHYVSTTLVVAQSCGARDIINKLSQSCNLRFRSCTGRPYAQVSAVDQEDGTYAIPMADSMLPISTASGRGLEKELAHKVGQENRGRKM